MSRSKQSASIDNSTKQVFTNSMETKRKVNTYYEIGESRMYSTRLPVPILDLAKRVHKLRGLPVSTVIRDGIKLVADREGVE